MSQFIPPNGEAFFVHLEPVAAEYSGFFVPVDEIAYDSNDDVPTIIETPPPLPPTA